MSKHWIINDSAFGRIKNLNFLWGKPLIHFIDDIKHKDPNWIILLGNLSDVFVLVADYDSQNLLRDGEKSWKELMTEDEYDILKKNRKYIVSYMLVRQENEHTHYIELFDTFVRNNNLGRVMINKYISRNQDVTLVPQQIIPSMAKYWGKVLGLYVENTDTGERSIYKEDIDEYIEDCNLIPNDLCWEYLYELCDL